MQPGSKRTFMAGDDAIAATDADLEQAAADLLAEISEPLADEHEHGHAHVHPGQSGAHILCCGREDPTTGDNIYRLPPDTGGGCLSNAVSTSAPDVMARCSAEHRRPDRAAGHIRLTMEDGESVYLCMRHWETHRQGNALWVYVDG